MGKSGFAKPEWPVVAEGVAPTLSAWQQDPATFVLDRCMARKIRADRDRRWSVSVTCQYQCGDKVAAGGLCGKCAGHKLKSDAGAEVAGCHPSWHGLITEAPPAYVEVFWGGVYRVGHKKSVTPVWSAVARPTVVRPRLTEEEKAARVASGGAGGPAKSRAGVLTAKALEAAMGLKLLEELRKSYATDLESLAKPGLGPKTTASLTSQSNARAKKLESLEATVRAEHKAKLEAKEAEYQELMSWEKAEGGGAAAAAAEEKAEGGGAYDDV